MFVTILANNFSSTETRYPEVMDRFVRLACGGYLLQQLLAALARKAEKETKWGEG